MQRDSSRRSDGSGLGRAPRAPWGWLPWAAAAVLCGLLLVAPVPCLSIRDARGALRAVFPLAGGASFGVSFRHSVTREPCTEIFRRGGGDKMLLVGAVFRGSGAGLPFGEEGGRVTIRDGWVVMEGLAREFERVRLAPRELTEHRLEIGGSSYDLAGLAGQTAELAIERLAVAALVARLAGRTR